jgi:hypothetical protein
MSHRSHRAAAALVVLLGLSAFASFAAAGTIRTGLIGGDLTDPENNGDPENNVNYNATFNASEEPTFGGAEGAFNVFDNQFGAAGGNTKFCCGDQNNFPANPITIDATFPTPHVLRRFTLTSANDTPDRNPRVWQIQGSNDGANFTPIFTQNDPAASVWTDINQTIEFNEGADFPIQSVAYSTLRFITTATGLTTGARFQLAEIEYFETGVPEPGSAALLVVAAGATLVRRRRQAIA